MEENKIPTAKEYLGWSIIGNIENPVEELKLIGFAKLHVKAALKAASENAKTFKNDEVMGGNGRYFVYIEVDKESILNAYPLENIK